MHSDIWFCVFVFAITVCAWPGSEISEAQTRGGGMVTRWAKDVSQSNPLPEYPRPMMVRKQWLNLNGQWDYAVTDDSVTSAPSNFAGKILVPFPIESALSGVQESLPPGKKLWYRRSFALPVDWSGARTLLHFDAVNWDATIILNGKEITQHKGGYDGFSVDLTAALQPGENELVVAVLNPLNIDVADAQVVGKQHRKPGGIFYTACTGIWQTVWLEPVPPTYIADLKIVADIDMGTLRVTAATEPAAASNVTITVSDGASTIATASGSANTNLELKIPNPHLWSPTDPHLYQLQISIQGGDAVNSYFAMRKISLGKDEQGHTRMFLNNKFVFEIGALDQGYWPDGIYTAPTDEALKSDIIAAKSLGFNMLRKHAKVESARWYYWADQLGMLVWQDMPACLGEGKEQKLTDAAKTQWSVEWKRIIAQNINYPSIIVWTTFNEDWGQHDTAEIVALTRQLDPTRLVNNASGWTDKGVGDLHDTHAYPGPGSAMSEEHRASVNGEFGGVTMRVKGHMWTTDLFGYGETLSEGREVTEKYQHLLKAAYALRDTHGTSAFVYTQLTDVEQESNGLLTYDREVIKPIAEMITAANQGRFIDLPPSQAQ